MVLDAVEAKARQLDLHVSDGAKELILQKALPYVNELNEAGELEEKVSTIQRNSAEFVQILRDQMQIGGAGEITIDHVSSLLSSICQKFPDFIPFCR